MHFFYECLLSFGLVAGFLLVFIAELYGGPRIISEIMERFDNETQKGLILTATLFIPVIIFAIIAGPFYAAYWAWKNFRKMPWS